MKSKICVTLSILFFMAGIKLNAQTNFDFTDSLANQQKQYIIRFDVANGNIYLPVKKKFRQAEEADKIFKRNKLFKADLVQIQKDIVVPLYKDTMMDGKIIHWKYTYVKVPNPKYKDGKDGKDVRYLVAGRYYPPKVGSFLRLVFENIPKNRDVKVQFEFVDKNLEHAATFANYLNSYQKGLNDAVQKDSLIENAKKDAKKLIDTINKENKKSDSIFLKNTTKMIDSLIKSAAHNAQEVQDHINVLIAKTGKEIDFTDIKQSLSNIAKVISIDTAGLSLDSSEFSKKNQNTLNLLKTNADKIGQINKEIENKLKGVYPDSIQMDVNILANNLKRTDSIFSKTYDSLIKILNDSITYFKKALYDTTFFIRDSVYNRRTIYIQPIQVDNTDLTVIHIHFMGDDVPIDRTIILKNKAGFKLDFSTGFIGTGLRDRNYRLFTRNDSSAIIPDDKGWFTIGFALLAHAYFRTGSRINFSLTSGFALNGSNQTVNYVLGASVPLGLEQRFIISAGLLFGKVQQLQAGYKVVPGTLTIDSLQGSAYSNYFYKGISNTGIPMINKWDYSYFIGISYNLGAIVGNSRRLVVGR